MVKRRGERKGREGGRVPLHVGQERIVCMPPISVVAATWRRRPLAKIWSIPEASGRPTHLHNDKKKNEPISATKILPFSFPSLPASTPYSLPWTENAEPHIEFVGPLLEFSISNWAAMSARRIVPPF